MRSNVDMEIEKANRERIRIDPKRITHLNQTGQHTDNAKREIVELKKEPEVSWWGKCLSMFSPRPCCEPEKIIVKDAALERRLK